MAPAGGPSGPTRVVDLFESGPSRLRFPRNQGPRPEGILVNTAGGIACGDTFRVDVALEAGADLVLTTTAAEKIYRSDGPVSRIANHLSLGPGARLAWLPQETILYDRARLARRFEADLAADARLLVGETLLFGRSAHGERVTRGLISDVWRIRRAGRLVYADNLHLDGPIADWLARPALGGGARALATLLDIAPDAESRLDAARAHLDALGTNTSGGVEAGASAWNGFLVVRLLAPDADALRRAVAGFFLRYRGEALPRVWQM
ncbi:urease accessory protein UreD [Methylobacterium soli]|uniref:Urease accessory protein UreD n=1 Tax=Methylobacterium soli TaxID=553447 RepID=A0A6L3SYZ5_9HYPH|nr:urease accessory protein UreD [Methylobacterium soli]KAB1077329.1 urease accessory protein UreD [Methylobacterium soli]GJE43417.1 Urease accessory protein UreD [Methylobacterium soli]